MVIGHLTGRWEGCARYTVSVGCLSVAGITLPGLAWSGLAKCFKCGHMSELGTISRVWAGSGQADNGRCSWSINTAPARVCSIHCSSGIHHAAGADTLIGHCCRGGERLLHSVEVVPSTVLLLP